MTHGRRANGISGASPPFVSEGNSGWNVGNSQSGGSTRREACVETVSQTLPILRELRCPDSVSMVRILLRDDEAQYQAITSWSGEALPSPAY